MTTTRQPSDRESIRRRFEDARHHFEASRQRFEARLPGGPGGPAGGTSKAAPTEGESRVRPVISAGDQA
jgi:hypothetical protein